LVKKQKKKSGKRQVRKDRKKRPMKQDWEQTWENRILVHILSSKYPVTASQLHGEIGIAQPIAFKILIKLKELECVKVSDQEDKLGPKRVWYAPTLWGLYYTCFMEFGIRTGTVDERIRKITTLQKFDAIYDRWIMNPVFSESVSDFVLPEYGIANKEVKDALKEYCKLAIKSQEAYEEVKNELSMEWRNMIGGAVVSQREPEYYMNTMKQLSKYIIPIRQEIDAVFKKTDELSNQLKYEKQKK
jgi:hypothetical protein